MPSDAIIRSVIPKINWVRLKSPVFTTNFVKSHEKSHETKNTSLGSSIQIIIF